MEDECHAARTCSWPLLRCYVPAGSCFLAPWGVDAFFSHRFLPKLFTIWEEPGLTLILDRLVWHSFSTQQQSWQEDLFFWGGSAEADWNHSILGLIACTCETHSWSNILGGAKWYFATHDFSMWMCHSMPPYDNWNHRICMQTILTLTISWITSASFCRRFA